MKAALERIDVREIITKHFATLKSDKPRDLWVVFLIFPFLFALLLAWIFNLVSIQKFESPVMSALSLLTGFLFNSLVFLNKKYLDEKVDTTDERLKWKRQLLKETFYNTAFTFLHGLTACIVIFVSFCIMEIEFHSDFLKYIVAYSFNTIIYFLILTLILFVLMILKRLNTAMTDDFNAE